MKTRINQILKSMTALALVLIMAACSQSVPSAEEVANRINTNQELTEADYTRMVDYCGKYAKEAQKYYDIINSQQADSVEITKAENDLATLYGDYSYLDLFRNSLASTDISKLGAENEKKVNEFAQYQGFPLPEGEGANLEDPNVVGMIEDMPQNDSSQVISTGVGEAVK